MYSTRQLIDSLTSHLSLYNSDSVNSSSNPIPNPNPRSSIIKWFSSLSVHQRQAHLTTVDVKFTQILLQMLQKLKSNGNGIFIVLPDIPQQSSPEQRTCSGTSSTSSLPSLCFRKSHGLLSRMAESNGSERLIRESTRLFSSKEGEDIKNFSLLGHASGIDSMTVTEEFVENVDRFVEIMDGVSNGQFLRGEESGALVTEWVEMEWLKSKGYYSMEAFVVNKLEVALRLAWLNCTSTGRKRGVKLKEKMNGVGIAANLFWRKKGCLDWWGKLDKEMKRKLFRMVVGRAAKCLAAECLKEKFCLGDSVWMQSLGHENTYVFQENTISIQRPDPNVGYSMASVSISGNRCSLASVLKSLVLLQDIYSMLSACQDIEHIDGKIFFSSLDAVSTTSDCVLRKLRELLMVVSLDCTKCELLGEGNGMPSTKNHKEKLATNDHKKKGKNRNMKRLKPMTRSSVDDTKFVKGTKGIGNGFLCSKSADVIQSNRMADKILEKDCCSEPLPSSVDMGCNRGVNNRSSQNSSRKNRKERKKLKSSSFQTLVEVESCHTKDAKMASASINSEIKAPNSVWPAEDSSVENVSGAGGTGNDNNEQSPEDCKSTSKVIHIPSMKNCKTTGMGVATDKEVHSVKCEMHPSATPIIPSVNSDDDLGRGVKNAKSGLKSSKSVFLGKLGKVGDLGKKVVPIHEQGSVGIVNSSVYLSYEWPSIAPSQVPPCNSHLPAATDRLHLDVGHNWQNHFHHSFVPAVHRMRNPPVENGCNGVMSRQMPMSLDWPPVVHGVNGLAQSVACNYDSGFICRRHSAYPQGFSASNVQRSLVTTDDERMYANDFMDFSDLTNSQEVVDEHENHWLSEEELELHAVPGMDYNQYFGGGVMYWNPSDYLGSNFSRPPSLSSDDSSWAWREADMNRAVDDMVAFSSSYSTNGLTSPSAASFCSPFDTKGPGHQALGYVLSESEIGGKVLHSSSTADPVTDETASLSPLSCEGEPKTGDSLPYPILRPIIIPNMSRDRSRSDFKHSHEHKSPCVPPSGREQPRIKRPPSPVVLCVPRAPRPPPPSPVSSSRRHRGFPTVRSGSSSPRHWGVKGWSYDGISFDETCIRVDSSEVVWPSWRSKSLSARQLTQPVPGALLQDRLIAISQLARDQEHPDVALPLQPPELLKSSTYEASLSTIHTLLHEEIDSFCKQVTAENLTRKPCINWAVKRVTRSLQVLWPRSRTNVFGSNATGLSLPSSDVDLVVCLPPVRNLEPIKEAGILEGRNGIKETCLQHAARYLANQEWVKNDSLKIVENTAIPIIMLVVEVPPDLMPSDVQTLKVVSTQGEDLAGSQSYSSVKYAEMENETGKDVNLVRLDISFKSPSHTGLQTTQLVKELTEQFPAATPLALVLKKFLADRSLDQSYSGGLSSYCLVLLIIRFLQHEHHLGRLMNQNYGSLLMDFLYFFGNVFDPRQMRVSVQGSGIYINREQGYSIDPIYIDDPLFPTNNVGRNCFRIHQCIKAFADAYSTLKNELTSLPTNDNLNSKPTYKLLPKLIPSIGHMSAGS